MKKTARAILEYLELNDVKYVFGIPSGTISQICDALNDAECEFIVTKHEANAAYMATKYAMASGKLGVCLVAGAVGANNALNGIAEAMRYKAPVLLLTGFIHTWQMGKGAIQELDTQDIFKPITKYSKTVFDSTQVLDSLREAMEIAMTPPCGPVHLSIPVDLQAAPFTGEMPVKIDPQWGKEPDVNSFTEVVDLINQEESGIIMVGRGCRGLANEVMQLSERLQWPIVTTTEAKGIVSADFPLCVGNYGFAGSPLAESFLQESTATCLLVLGSSLGETATNNFNSRLVDNRKVIQIDLDSRELGKVFEADIKIKADLRTVIPHLLEKTNPKKKQFLRPKAVTPETTGVKLSLRSFFQQISEILPEDTYYVSDLGEFATFLTRYLTIPQKGSFIMNLNYGTMGSGIGGAPGVYLANPDRQVAVFAGDGSFFMNGNVLFTVKEYNFPIVFFIVNNSMLGLVHNGHKCVFERSVPGITMKRTSIAQMMQAAGIRSMSIQSNEEIPKIKEFLADVKEPRVIELITDGQEVGPIVDRVKSVQVAQ